MDNITCKIEKHMCKPVSVSVTKAHSTKGSVRRGVLSQASGIQEAPDSFHTFGPSGFPKRAPPLSIYNQSRATRFPTATCFSLRYGPWIPTPQRPMLRLLPHVRRLVDRQSSKLTTRLPYGSSPCDVCYRALVHTTRAGWTRIGGETEQEPTRA